MTKGFQITETVGFVGMLERFARRRPGEDISPDNGENINCSIVLIARPAVYLARGLAPYLSWINKCCKKGIQTFYVSAIGDANISMVRRIRMRMEQVRRYLSFQRTCIHLIAREQ